MRTRLSLARCVATTNVSTRLRTIAARMPSALTMRMGTLAGMRERERGEIQESYLLILILRRCKVGFFDETTDPTRTGRVCIPIESDVPTTSTTTLSPNLIPCGDKFCHLDLGEVGFKNSIIIIILEILESDFFCTSTWNFDEPNWFYLVSPILGLHRRK